MKIISRSARPLLLAFAVGLACGGAFLHYMRPVRHTATSRAANRAESGMGGADDVGLKTRITSEGSNRNLAYWDSATATAREIKEIVKDELKRELGFEEQAELLIGLAKQVEELRGISPALDGRIRTTPAPTPKSMPVCVNNPPVHYERTGEMIKECSPYLRAGSPATAAFPGHTYVVTLKPASPAVLNRIAYLRQQGISASAFLAVNGSKTFEERYHVAVDPKTSKPTLFYTNPANMQKHLRRGDPGFLTPGELGYLASMKALLEHAVTSHGNESILVLDDDAVLDCSFRQSLQRLLEDDRCSAPLNPGRAGVNRTGMLLLGAAVWITGTYPKRGDFVSGWRITDAELNALRIRREKAPMCFNAHSKTFGSYAVMYHPSIFRSVIEWIDKTELAFDHIYPAMVRQQKMVRVAYPNLVIQNVSHVSQIDPLRNGQNNFSWRANIHRWEPVGRYCDPQSGLPLVASHW